MNDTAIAIPTAAASAGPLRISAFGNRKERRRIKKALKLPYTPRMAVNGVGPGDSRDADDGGGDGPAKLKPAVFGGSQTTPLTEDKLTDVEG